MESKLLLKALQLVFKFKSGDHKTFIMYIFISPDRQQQHIVHR